MRIKHGASIKGIHAEMAIACLVCSKTLEEFNKTRLTLTEGTGGVHMKGSFHGKGLAIDLRDWALNDSQLKELVRNLNLDLGNILVDEKWEGEFDVVLEGNHIHVEFDVK